MTLHASVEQLGPAVCDPQSATHNMHMGCRNGQAGMDKHQQSIRWQTAYFSHRPGACPSLKACYRNERCPSFSCATIRSSSVAKITLHPVTTLCTASSVAPPCIRQLRVLAKVQVQAQTLLSFGLCKLFQQNGDMQCRISAGIGCGLVRGLCKGRARWRLGLNQWEDSTTACPGHHTSHK